MNIEALIKKPRTVLESAHQDLNNRGGLELIGHHLGAVPVPGEVLQGRGKHLQKFHIISTSYINKTFSIESQQIKKQTKEVRSGTRYNNNELN